MEETQQIVPIAVPGVHQRFYTLFKKEISRYKNPRILEIGAGHGAFTKKLYDEGFDVHACDLFPEYFRFDQLECKYVDITKALPYDDRSFDVIIAIEVMEHIHDHNVFFRECQRILKPGGMVAVSTPNILSIKSRIRFLFSGFFYSFKPLDHTNTDGLQHISSLTADQYVNLGKINQFKSVDIEIDRKQTTSKIFSFLIPFMKLYCWHKNIQYNVHNTYKLLVGRVLFILYRK